MSLSFNSSLNKKNPDHYYYDCSIINANNFDDGITPNPQCAFTEYRDFGIFEGPANQWEMSVIRFTCEGGNLPILIFQTQLNQTNLNL